MQGIIDNTPIQAYQLLGRTILVKREDLCCPPPGPSFSKIRGVAAHIATRPEKVIGVLDTFHSKAGWAVAYVCKQLGKRCVDFWPVFKADKWDGKSLPREQQQQAAALGAMTSGIPAGRSAILYHHAKKRLATLWEDSYMMPNALKLPESVEENAAEVVRTAVGGDFPVGGTVVLSVSSGTVAAGVLKGLARVFELYGWTLILHMGYTRSHESLTGYVEERSGVRFSEFANVRLVDEGYGYKDEASKDGPDYPPCPFPCNSHYDLKAWRWLQREENLKTIPAGPVVFWNIGD